MPHDHETSSECLMARYQKAPDAAAFERIVSRFLAPALGVAQQMLSERGLAEDAVQETFLRIVRRRERYLPSKPFSTWFYAILRNVCRDMLRRRARQQRIVRELAHQVATQAEPPSFESLDAMNMLAGLPKDARAVVTLRIVHGLPFRDVAAALGISEEAAKKRAQRALRLLHKQLEGNELRRRLASLRLNVALREGEARAGLRRKDVPGTAT
jgi:RNA polymerase sigma-70 factor (ECF subfamily)